ncbi:universal stress protein [Listeria sp. PSOL-1]|uniref:universal stress protein n=1 Tax=Listeria sp. PSOL-1 TaxID=1844999 RepID=UPI0013CFA696|nr:universal stress protein [Listeria sp. PSOL-1]
MTKKYQRILIALDGSEESELAFRRGVELALELNAHVGLATVIDTRSFPAYSPDGGMWENQLSSDMEKSIAKHVERAKESGITTIDHFIEKGNPKKLLSDDLPNLYKADLIICGATGLNRIEEAVLGSVSGYIIQHALCDVLIVRD